MKRNLVKSQVKTCTALQPRENQLNNLFTGSDILVNLGEYIRNERIKVNFDYTDPNSRVFYVFPS